MPISLIPQVLGLSEQIRFTRQVEAAIPRNGLPALRQQLLVGEREIGAMGGTGVEG